MQREKTVGVPTSNRPSETTKEGDRMTTDDILKAYTDKVSQDQTDFRQDMRDLTAHTDHRLDRIEDMLRENNAQANDRINRIEDVLREDNK